MKAWAIKAPKFGSRPSYIILESIAHLQSDSWKYFSDLSAGQAKSLGYRAVRVTVTEESK